MSQLASCHLNPVSIFFIPLPRLLLRFRLDCPPAFWGIQVPSMSPIYILSFRWSQQSLSDVIRPYHSPAYSLLAVQRSQLCPHNSVWLTRALPRLTHWPFQFYVRPVLVCLQNSCSLSFKQFFCRDLGSCYSPLETKSLVKARNRSYLVLPVAHRHSR